MSLSDAGWQEFTRASNIQETWIARLYYDAAGASDFIQISDRDFVDGNGDQVLGVVQDWGDIRRSIDLAKFVAKIDNLSLAVANPLYHGVRLIEELRPGSTRKYLNRKVEIYTEVNGAYTSRMQLYNGRLRGVSWTADEIKLEVEQAQPWDFLSFPNVKAASGRYFPAVYGDFTYNSSTPTTPGYCSSFALWPSAVDRVTNESLWALLPKAYATNEVRPHFFEDSMDRFVPVVNASEAYPSASTTTYDSAGDAVAADIAMLHALKLKPKALSEIRASTFTDPERAFNSEFADETTLYATATITTGTAALYVQLTQSELDVYEPGAGVQLVITTPVYFSRGGAPQPKLWLTVDGGTSFILEYAPASSGDATITWTVTSAMLPGGVIPQSLGFYFFIFGGTTSCTCRIKDVRVKVVTRTNPATDEAGLKRAKEQAAGVETLYFGGDGLGRSWTTGNVTLIHELHRDILHRVVGYTTAPDNWAALDTARAGWSCRWWSQEPVEVKKLLEQAQYEGAFVFIWSMTTTGTGRYLFVKDTYSSTDVAATLSELDDTEGIEYSHTPFDELVTKQVINYERHPADSRYISSYTYTNTTARTNWNIQTLENVETVDLDMLTGAVNTWAGIRDRIFGDLKRIITCDIVNPRYFILEVGDVIQMSDDTRYFMITDERRTPGRLNITAREVYA